MIHFSSSKNLKPRHFLTLLSLCFITPFSFASELHLHLDLKPAGDFIAKSDQLKGSALKESDGKYVVENAEIDLNSFKTGISLRDRHMKEKYFETQKPGYEKAVLKKAIGKGGKFQGILMIRNTSVKINGTFEVSSDQKTGKFSFKTKMSDYKIPKASYMGVGVADEVMVTGELPIQ